MKTAILSDVHANLEALTAVFEDLERRCVQRILFLGDAVGYGADPAPCLEMLENSAFRFVAGNHDRAAGNERGRLEHFHEDAAAALLWTRTVLDQDARNRLRALPLHCLDGQTCLVHGSPHKPETWPYVVSARDAEKGFGASGSRVVLVGHTHVPAAYVEEGATRLFTGVMRRIKAVNPERVEFDTSYRYLLNTGSVGQPRDGDPRAAYAIFEPEAARYTLHRVPYDVEKAAVKIRKAGLPERLAERLKAGN